MAEQDSYGNEDQLLCALRKCEGRLQEWLGQSENNARWFARDPMAAMYAADLGLDLKIVEELKTVTAAIAGKMNSEGGPPAHRNITRECTD